MTAINFFFSIYKKPPNNLIIATNEIARFGFGKKRAFSFIQKDQNRLKKKHHAQETICANQHMNGQDMRAGCTTHCVCVGRKLANTFAYMGNMVVSAN